MHHPPHLDIDKLITDENDPKFRVLLMLVKSLSDYLAGNTEAFNDMSNKLDAHLSAFEARAARWTCNEFCAWCIGLADPWRFDCNALTAAVTLAAQTTHERKPAS